MPPSLPWPDSLTPPNGVSGVETAIEFTPTMPDWMASPMAAAVELLKVAPASELIWASPRELLNIFHADSIGCQVITVTNDILKKLSLVGKNLDDYSLETVKMFADDAIGAGFKL